MFRQVGAHGPRLPDRSGGEQTCRLVASELTVSTGIDALCDRNTTGRLRARCTTRERASSRGAVGCHEVTHVTLTKRGAEPAEVGHCYHQIWSGQNLATDCMPLRRKHMDIEQKLGTKQENSERQIPHAITPSVSTRPVRHLLLDPGKWSPTLRPHRAACLHMPTREYSHL